MITINPGQNIQSIINGNPSETVFQIQNGLHRITSALTLRAGLTFQGESLAAILSGSKELHSAGDATNGSFVDAGGGRFSISGQTQQGTVNNLGECQVGFPECHQPEDLWIDEVLQIPQTNITDVDGPGKWHFDYGNNVIYIWASPANKQVETSVTQKAINAGPDNCNLITFKVEKFAVPFQSGAIEGDDDGGEGWLLDGLEVTQCHGQGIRMNKDWTLQNAHVHHCGQLGLGGTGQFSPGKATGVIVQDTEIDNNGVSGINPGAAGGALKFTSTKGLILRRCNVHHNPGNGIWFDIDNEDAIIEDCIVEDNGYQGIFYEISFRAVIRNNVVRRNGFGRNNGSGFGAGIFVAASPGVEIYGNLVEDCHNGIAATQQDRGSGDDGGVQTLHVIKDLFVHHNTVILLQTGGDPQRVGLWVNFQPPGEPGLYTAEANNRWVGNSYDLSGATALCFHWNDANIDFADWQAAGQDPPGPPTRFYMDSAAAPSVSPVISAGWEVLGGTDRYRRMNRQKLGSAFATRNVISSAVLGDDMHWRSFVYQGLPEMLLAGHFRGMVRCNQSNGAADERIQCRVLVTSQDGSVVRGVLVEFDEGLDDPPAGEFNLNALQARKVPRGWTGSGVQVTPVQTVAGDCLVVELGYRHMESGTTRSGFLQNGDPISSNDLVEDETNLSEAAGWFEFSATIDQATPQVVSALAIGVATLTAKQVVGKVVAATAVGVAALGTQLIEAPGPGNPTRPKPRPKHNRRKS